MAENSNPFDPEFDGDPEAIENESVESLQAQLRAYNEALAHDLAEQSKHEPDNITQIVKKNAAEDVANSLGQIRWLRDFAESENVRLNSAKYLVELAIAAEEKDADPISDLIKQLQTRPPRKRKATADQGSE